VFPSSFEDLQCLVGNVSGSQVGKIDSVLRVEVDESLLGSADAFGAGVRRMMSFS